MNGGEISLRVLIANERRDRLELLAQVVAGLGHEVIAREIDVREVGAVTAREHPDVALVGLGLSSEHALELISEIVQIYDNYGFETQVLVASVRHPMHVQQAALLGAHVMTAPLSVLLQLSKHPLTDIGLEKFLKDWEKVPK